jgi:hypothetical protein
MEKYLASCWVKDEEITVRIKQVVACPGDHGEYPLYELDGGERQRHYPWCKFESIHDTREAAELWIANRLEGFAQAIHAKAEELRHAAAERTAKAQIEAVA